MINHPRLIGLVGAAGAGKDTTRSILEALGGPTMYTGTAFADPIRMMIGALLDAAGVDRKWMTDRSLKERPIPGIGASYRYLAQTLGTEWGRNLVHRDLWLNVTMSFVDRNPKAHLVISDVRFDNEVQAICERGGEIWLVERPGVEAVQEHESEDLHSRITPDFAVFNNGSVVDLANSIRSVLEIPR